MEIIDNNIMNKKIKERMEMPAKVIDDSQQKAAKIAGFTFIFSIAIVIISNYNVTFRYIVPDAAETAKNLIAHDTLFRINVVGDLVYFLTLIVMSTSLYVILKPINKNFALATVFIRLVYAFMWSLMAINILNALYFLGNSSFLKVFETDQLEALSRLRLNSSFYAYYIGLPFWGLSSTICSILLFRSKYIPRVLAIFGIISSVWCVFCAFTFLIFPTYVEIVHAALFDVPMVLFEVILGFWFLVKGLKPKKIAQTY